MITYRHTRFVISSLLFVLSLTTGMQRAFASNERRIAELQQRCISSMTSFNYHQLGVDASLMLRLLDESQQESRESGYANLYKGVAVMMGENATEARGYLDKALDTGWAVNNDSLVALTLNSLGIYEANVNSNLYLAQRYFIQSGEVADRCGFTLMKNGTRSNLASVAAELNDTTGITYAMESYRDALTQGWHHERSSAATILAKLYNLKGDTAVARIYIAVARNIVDSCGFEVNAELLLEEAVIEETAGDYDRAIECVRQCIPLLVGQRSHTLPDAYLQLGSLLLLKKDYPGALACAEDGIDACGRYAANLQLGKLYKLKADCFSKIGRPDSAVVYLRKANQQIENGHNLQMKHLENERRLMSEMDAKDKKAAVDRIRMSMQTRLILALVASVALLVIVIVVLVYNHRRRKRLYDSLVSKNQDSLALADRLRDEIEEMRNRSAVVFSNAALPDSDRDENDVTVKGKGISREKGARLFEEACRLMREERLYADPKFTREDLIERLGTNHTYFTQLIKDFAGTNFTQFINSYRIEEAIRILSDVSRKDYPLKSVCSDVGFGSTTSFYKFFQAATGVTPSIYRKTILEKSGEE